MTVWTEIVSQLSLLVFGRYAYRPATASWTVWVSAWSTAWRSSSSLFSSRMGELGMGSRYTLSSGKTLRRIQHRQQALSLLALDPQRAQPDRPIPTEHLRNRPPAESATCVMEQHGIYSALVPLRAAGPWEVRGCRTSQGSGRPTPLSEAVFPAPRLRPRPRRSGTWPPQPESRSRRPWQTPRRSAR